MMQTITILVNLTDYLPQGETMSSEHNLSIDVKDINLLHYANNDRRTQIAGGLALNYGAAMKAIDTIDALIELVTKLKNSETNLLKRLTEYVEANEKHSNKAKEAEEKLQRKTYEYKQLLDSYQIKDAERSQNQALLEMARKDTQKLLEANHRINDALNQSTAEKDVLQKKVVALNKLLDDMEESLGKLRDNHILVYACPLCRGLGGEKEDCLGCQGEGHVVVHRICKLCKMPDCLGGCFKE